MTPQYDIDYFIAKFTAIPEEQWCMRSFTDRQGRHCAVGHCGADSSDSWSCNEEAMALTRICRDFLNDSPTAINDYKPVSGFSTTTPRQRILAALHLAKTKFEAQAEAFELRPIITKAKEVIT